MKHYRSLAAAIAVLALPMVSTAYADDDVRYAAQQEEAGDGATQQADEGDVSISYQMEIISPELLTVNSPTTARFALSRNGEPLTFDKLKTVHTRKIHALLADPTLVDYQHVHPRPTRVPGEYTMKFTPKTDRPYLLWLDITPSGAQQLYLRGKFNGSNNETPLIDRTETREVTVGGYHFTLSFDGPVKAGEAVMGHVSVAQALTEEPVASLQPLMGAFAHIVGIADDDETITHIHPLGAEPTDDSQRGGPRLDFHFEAKNPGFVKLFAQVQIGGKQYYAPFGVVVE